MAMDMSGRPVGVAEEREDEVEVGLAHHESRFYCTQLYLYLVLAFHPYFDNLRCVNVPNAAAALCHCKFPNHSKETQPG